MTLKGHTSSVWACAYSPDGRHIVSASDDQTPQDGKERIRIQCFGQRDWAGLDPANNRVLWTQGAAWRRLGWLALDPERGVLERYPAEVFGPLPQRG